MSVETSVSTMRAAFLERLESLVVCEVPHPEAGSDGFVVRVRACGVCGSDVRTFYHGHHALQLPQVLGHEIAGEVAEVGGGVPGVREGDRVTFSAALGCGECRYCRQNRYNLCINLKTIGESLPGGFAEYVYVPAWIARAGGVVQIPDHVPFELASVAEPMSCVLNAQDLLRVGAGDTVLVIGLGPIGCMHLVSARARGAERIIAADTAPERVEVARRFGADAYVQSGTEDLEHVVMEETDGVGADVVVVACGVASVQAQAVELAASGGRVSFFGGLPKDDPTVLLDANRIHYREISVMGAFGARMHHIHEAMGLISADPVTFEPLVTHLLPLADIVRAFRTARDRRSLRVVVTP